MITVLTVGTFDMLHPGHLELFRACQDISGSGGTVLVGLNRDEFIQRYKGHPPVLDYRARFEMLDACRLVDAVLCNAGDEDAKPIIEVARPHVIAVGSDWLDRNYLAQLGVTRDWVRERGIRIEYVQRTRGLSSTAIRGALAS